MALADGSPVLVRDERGIYTAGGGAPLSYPPGGNRDYFRVEDGSLWFRHRSDCIVSVMKRFPPSGTVLDVGGGNGFVTARMLAEGFDAVLLEPGPEGALNALTGRGIPEVICSTLEEAALPASSVPAVGCFDVLEHIEDDAGFIGLVRRQLVPGGMLYGTVPAGRWLWSASDRSAGHFRRYSRRDLARLLSGGFEIMYTTGMFGAFTVPLFVSRVIPYRLGLSRLPGRPSLEREHGIGAGRLVTALYRRLGRELESVQSGRRLVSGTSLLFAAVNTGRS
jgi:SAM-dependent methyltransferase